MPASPSATPPDTFDTPNIPSDLPPNPLHWDQQHVKLYFEANQEEYGLGDEGIELIYKNEIRGRHFPVLTKEKLTSHPFNISWGAAATVIKLIRLLIKPQQGWDITLKYGKDTKTVYCELQRGKNSISLDFFRTNAMKLFTFPEGTELSDIAFEIPDHKDPKKTVILDTDDVPPSKVEHGKLTLLLSTVQRPFSSWTFENFKAQFGIIAESYAELDRFDLPSIPVDGKKTKELIDDAVKEISKAVLICPTAISGNESTRSLVVYEVLKQVTYACGCGGNFRLYSEKEVSGKLGTGPVDYVFEYEGLLIMVIEAKKRDLDQGVAQCAVQLDSAIHINRKRKQEDLHHGTQHLFGIVTTGDVWVFLRLDQGKKPHVLVHKGPPVSLSGVHTCAEGNTAELRRQIAKLFSHILAIYKETEDSTIITKRPKLASPEGET